MNVIKQRLPKRLRRSLAMGKISARALFGEGKGAKDFALSTVSAALRADRSLGRPIHVTIEPTNICNLRCPVCETGEGTLGRRGGHMELDAFRPHRRHDGRPPQRALLLLHGRTLPRQKRL